MAFKMETRTDIENEIDSPSAAKNRLRAVLAADGDKVDLYDYDFDDIVVRVKAQDDAQLDEFMKIYAAAREHGFEAGKFDKAAEIRRALDI
ncbi:MAG: hypothetical protein J0H40_05635 [Rhizobiales bacterium]|nr:hypothetical protein [Hyphomicrobiales bacterium]